MIRVPDFLEWRDAILEKWAPTANLDCDPQSSSG
jgi:hypothetical protein